MTDSIIYLNGSLVSGNTAALSPYDHGFLYGHGLFETMRSYRGKVFRLQSHLGRLANSMSMLGWPQFASDEEFEAAIHDTLAANQLSEASVRLTVSRGVGPARPDAASCGKPTVMVFALPYVPLSQECYEEGWSLATVGIRRNLSSPLYSIKSANYLDNLLAKTEAQQRGAREALILNTAGNIAEGTMSNIFFVIAGKLVTPDLASGILPGVTRAVVLELALQAGLLVEDRPVSPKEISEATEVFLTSSLVEIIPVTMLDSHKIGDGRPGGITRKLSTLYREQVKIEIANNK